MEIVKERQNIEFIDKKHFGYMYKEFYAENELSMYIEYCWETRFERLLKEVPQGFSDVLFPNIGYTYVIVLGTPLKIEIGDQTIDIKASGFLPRHAPFVAHHSVGNKMFGIKFKVCPIVFEKDIDFSDYKQYVYPLAYLMDKSVIEMVRAAQNFQERSHIIFQHYNALLKMHSGSLGHVTTVTEILKKYEDENDFKFAIAELAEQYKVSPRSLGKYFETTTSFSTKQALQIIRIRKAVDEFVVNPQKFNYAKFNYCDFSHFYRHLKRFTAPFFHHFQHLHKIK